MVKGRISRLGVLAGLVLGMGATSLSRGAEAEGFVYSSFTGDGEDGLHLLTSLDGVTWQHVSGYSSVFKQAEGLMRDPSICRGGDGKYHLVWTTGWWNDTLGISHSDNLKDWERSRFLSVWADYRGPGTEESDGVNWPKDLSQPAPRHPKVRNCWAPEIFYDEDTKEYVIFWATTIDDASVFPKTWDARRWERMNQRIYFISTKDFKTYTPRRFFYAPEDRMVIDAMIRRIAPGSYRMIIKDEMAQTLHVCSSTTRLDTWSSLPSNFWGRMSSPAFTGAGIQPDNTPAEGPSLVQAGAEWLIYCDYWAKGRNGLFSTRDFVTMTRLNEEFHAPNWVRHGTVFKVPMAVLKALSPDHAQVYMRAMGVENVTVNSARLKGRVTYASGAGNPVVSVYWGPVNRGRDKAAWRNRIEVGPRPVGREFEIPLTGLVHNTPYYYTLCGSNSDGGGWSSVATFQTLTAVDVSTADATEIGLFSARLNGRVNPCNADAAMWFEYGPGTDVSHSTAKGRAGSTNHFVAFNETITKLEPDTVYTFRGMAENAAGWSATGTNGTFRTRALVATLEATHLGVSSATLNGEVNPNNLGSYVWFEYGTTTNYGARTSTVAMGSGNASMPFSRELAGLIQNTLYHCRAMSSNVTGVVKAGADKLFQTLPSATMITYDFDDGTLQGWTTVSADPGTVKDGQRYVATDWDKTHKGPKAVFCSNFGARDNAHQTLWIRSPAFLINQPGDLTLWLLGGAGRGEWPGRTGTLPTHESQIPLAGQSTLDGVMGVALRDTASRKFVLTGQRTTSAGGANWTQIVWDVTPFLNNGRTYTVELFDYHSGNGYSQLALDTVTIPGKQAPTSQKREKERSLVLDAMSKGNHAGLNSETAIGNLAVAGRLSIDLHAEFMASRSYGTETVLNWYNCGYSGGGGKDGKFTKVGGNFGDFGFHVPFKEREEKYPHAVTVDKVRAIRFDGGDFLKGNFAVEDKIAGEKNMAIEVWFRSEKPAKGDVILGWQSRDGKESSGPFTLPANFAGSGTWRHLLVNCTPEKEDVYLDGVKVASGKRSMVVKDGHVMVLGGASASKPSFKGDLVAVRLHDQTMTDGEIAHNFKGGVMLGTEMHNWWRTEPDKWYVVESEHFRHALDKEEMKKWDARRLKEFNERVPGMFRKAELCYLIYSERMAMRSAVVSANADERGDGIKYRTPIQPHDRSVMGFDGRFGWACQGAGDINPHELVHGWQAMTGGGMEGSFWETHANFPQTYAGIYQTTPSAAVLTSQLHPANGRTYYDDRTFFEHLSQTPGYGPMIISKFWFDGAVDGDKHPSPWMSFLRLNPYPERTLADEYIKMAMRNITWDYKIFLEAKDGLGGNTPYGNDGVENKENIYLKDFNNNGDRAMRHGRTILEKIPYGPEWWRVPKAQAPQQLGYNICPLKFRPGKVTATLAGYVDEGRGGDWRAGFVGVDKNGKPVYGETFGPGKTQSYDANGNMKELYLVVAAIPKKIMPIDGDYRSASQEQFPYKVKLDGCEPRTVLPPGKPNVPGKAHPNGGGFVADTAKVDATAYVGPNAQVLDKAVVSGNSRIEDFAVVSNDAKVLGNAVVSEYVFVTGNATVSGNAKIRDYGKVNGKTTVSGNAKILELATIDTQKNCTDNVTVKGCAYVYGGNQSGTAMIDGFYAKGQDITNGKWFTWSWGGGKNRGEEDEDFGGLYADYDFNRPHGWMAFDSFGATFGYMVNGAKIEIMKERVVYKSTLKRPEEIIPALDPKQNIGDGYARQLWGYLLPKETGDYTFWISADDEGECWLGEAGSNKADKKLCFISSWVPPMEFTRNPSQKSATMRLEKGKAYPIMVLHGEIAGGDHVQVAWRKAGSDKPEIIGAANLSVAADGKQPGVRQRIWSDVSTIADMIKRPDYPEGKVRIDEGALVLNGKDQFVELQRDIADMGNCTYSATVTWDGATDGSRIFEFANANGDAMWLSPSEGGKLVFALREGNTVEQVTAPAMKKGVWTTIQAIVDGKTASLHVNGKLAAENKNFTLRPDSIRATQCYLGRGAKGGYFGGEIDKFTVHCVALSEGKPLPDQAGEKTAK